MPPLRLEEVIVKIGTVVQIKPNSSIFDCCQGKRGRIAHLGVGGGWLLNTDHFCPVERHEDELEVVPLETLAEEHLAKQPIRIREAYEAQTSEYLREFVPRGDICAWAVLILRGEPIEE